MTRSVSINKNALKSIYLTKANASNVCPLFWCSKLGFKEFRFDRKAVLSLELAASIIAGTEAVDAFRVEFGEAKNKP